MRMLIQSELVMTRGHLYSSDVVPLMSFIHCFKLYMVLWFTGKTLADSITPEARFSAYVGFIY